MNVGFFFITTTTSVLGTMYAAHKGHYFQGINGLDKDNSPHLLPKCGVLFGYLVFYDVLAQE
jgi:hypothetical protein